MHHRAISDPKQHVISTTTILILSAIVIVISEFEFGPLNDDLSFFLTSCGLVGMIGFWGLDLESTHRAQLLSTMGDVRTENRLSRHVAATALPSREIVKTRAQLLEWLKSETRDLS